MRRRSLLKLATAVCALAAILPVAAASAADPVVTPRAFALRLGDGHRVLIGVTVRCDRGRLAYTALTLRQNTATFGNIAAANADLDAFPPNLPWPLFCSGEDQTRWIVVNTNGRFGTGGRFEAGDAEITADTLIFNQVAQQDRRDVTLR